MKLAGALSTAQGRIVSLKACAQAISSSAAAGSMAPGAGIAFLITGAGTSVGAISGMLVIARWRIVALVIACLFVTAIATGWLAGLWL